MPAHNGVSFGRHVRAGTIVTVAGGPCRNDANPPPVAVAIDAAGDLFIDYSDGQPGGRSRPDLGNRARPDGDGGQAGHRGRYGGPRVQR